MFCCQCEVVKENKESIDIGVTFDEGVTAQELMGGTDAQDVTCLTKQRRSPGDVTPSTSEGNQSARTESSGDEEKSQAKRERPQTARSEKSMDEETKKAEKDRLHSMLKSFSREAVLGLSCQVLEKPEGTQDWTEQWSVTAKFSLDRALTNATIDYCGRKLMFSLSDLQDVYAYEDLMDELPDPQIGQVVTKEDRHKAVFVHHHAQNLPEPWIVLLLNDEAEVERFASCLKILKLYTQSKAMMV
eukprot:gnl/MRDRNA2_/MRDRNA2_79481_c0_seq2.p1 gnl/MRDRNA2_/MRDRNA2_79481_c0~~gnl/MRDRNA2_/MRDRNA2_79481_c0_seq2.p1  ORF type:complete len:244 (-),score=49.18 gnl/MRDRNA2_/MRDRNA2_79481_c0_seq2:248-979(-)